MKLKGFPNDRQLDLMDCGPACIKMISKYFGKYYSLQYLRDLCGITKEGVSFLDISYAAEKIGLKTFSFKCSIQDLLVKVPLPAILHWSDSHFVVVYKAEYKSKKIKSGSAELNGSIYISDPAKGYLKYSVQEFSEKWIKQEDNLGVVMAIEPQAEFYQKQSNEKIERKKTFDNFIGYFRPYKRTLLTYF